MTDLPENCRQALTLAQLLIDFEIEQPQVYPAPEAWTADLRTAREALAQLLQLIPREPCPPNRAPLRARRRKFSTGQPNRWG